MSNRKYDRGLNCPHCGIQCVTEQEMLNPATKPEHGSVRQCLHCGEWIRFGRGLAGGFYASKATAEDPAGTSP